MSLKSVILTFHGVVTAFKLVILLFVVSVALQGLVISTSVSSSSMASGSIVLSSHGVVATLVLVIIFLVPSEGS